MKILLALLSAVGLVSCASGPFYQQGPPDLSKSAMFLRENKAGTAFLRPTNFFLSEIDGTNAGRPIRFPNGEKGFAVTPGDHRMGVAMLRSQPGTGLITAEATIPMKVRVGGIYEVMGSTTNPQRVDLWIRDRSTRKQVSQTISAEATDHGIPAITVALPAS